MDYEKLIQFRDNPDFYARHMGVHTLKIGEGFAQAELEVGKEHFNPVGSVHGGVLFTLADTESGAASASYGDSITTLNASVNFLRAVREPMMLVGTSVVEKRGKKVIVVNTEITDEDGTLYFSGTFSFFNLGFPIQL